MLTTLDIDQDVLSATQTLAQEEKKTPGQKLSELARMALNSLPPKKAATSVKSDAAEEFCGFRPFPSRGGVVTDELINRLREGDVY